MRLSFVYSTAVVQLQHPIQVVSRLTGLSPHVIRVWEKRYRAVTPARTETNRRLYTDDEVERLRLLGLATEAGHKIGIIAKLPLEDLQRLVRLTSGSAGGDANGTGESRGGNGHPAQGGQRWGGALGQERGLGAEGRASRELVQAAMERIRAYDADGLVQAMEQGAMHFGYSGLLHRIVCPLAREIGERWQRGEIAAAHEHFASAAIRDFLVRTGRPFALSDTAPRAVVGTPAGQLHELGAVMVAALASNLGWRTIYLGSSLPAAEIAGACKQNRASAVLLSLVYPSDDPQLGGEMVLLRKLLPPEAEIVVGGRASRSYGPFLKEIRAICPGDLDELRGVLEEMRESGMEGTD
ncbi:MAG: MerR family transcriptional regulator [Verrucomicrobiae bacterium]|nr:MerR family transcriptional regulator [Verrucomicrobiae bacterium]